MIDLNRWSEIKQIVQGALDLPEEEREGYLDSACGGDVELRREVEVLLAVSETQARAIDNLQVLPDSVGQARFTVGDLVGACRIVRPLGEGGMGTVYLAEDTQHKRHVALKTVPKRGGRVLTHEQELLAQLPSHPNIATLHTSGQTAEGFGYFIMEYVEGEPITDYCDRKNLTLTQRLELFATVCDAAAFAHRNLVVHRDIKPSNILVNPDGQPKLLDFGSGKRLPSEATAVTLTRTEDRGLTLAFASPEQLEGELTTTATDIYSLGVLLCLLLTGRLPYTVKNYSDLPWAIRNAQLVRPSQLVIRDSPPLSDENVHVAIEPRGVARSLAGDLDAIVLKALRREPELRYDTVADLAADVRRFLTDQPVLARRGSTRYRASKFWKRHTLAVVVSALIITVLVALTVRLFVLQHRTEQQRDNAEQIAGILNGIFTLSNPWTPSGDQLTARQMLDRATAHVRRGTVEPLQRATALHTLGNLYAQLGINEHARELLSEALELRIRHLVEGHKDTTATRVALGGALYYLGEYKEARRHLDQARTTLESQPGVDPRGLAVPLSHLGRVAYEEGKPQEAEALERQALRLLEAAQLGSSKEAAELHSHLGLTLNRLDRLPEAERHHRKSLATRVKLFGHNHPVTAEAHHNLAWNLNSQGRYREAEQHYRTALAIARRSLPPEHPFLPAILDSLATTCAYQDRSSEAESLLREALAIKKRILPKDHPSIPLSIANLAGIIMSKHPERFPEAEPLYLEAIAAFRQLEGDQSREVGLALYSYGRALWKSGEPERARPVAAEAAYTIESAQGPNHIETALTQRLYARVLLELEKPADAEPLLANAVRIFRHHQPPDPFELASTLTSLGRCRLELGDRSAARAALTEARDLFEQLGRLDSPEGRESVAVLDFSRRTPESPGAVP